jgi:thiol-disulfide isomerase/thioredoxin
MSITGVLSPRPIATTTASPVSVREANDGSFHRRAVLTLMALGLSLALTPSGEAAVLPSLSQWLLRLNPPSTLPALKFEAESGRLQTLSDYKGAGVVLNVWATWCVPCQAEMPALDRLSAALKGDGIVVLPISVDDRGQSVVKKFYAAHDIEGLPILYDRKGSVRSALKASGIPTTAIIDRSGKLAGLVLGAVEWDAPASIALLRRMIGPQNGSADTSKPRKAGISR